MLVMKQKAEIVCLVKKMREMHHELKRLKSDSKEGEELNEGDTTPRESEF